jgi:hypothetical protein
MSNIIDHYDITKIDDMLKLHNIEADKKKLEYFNIFNKYEKFYDDVFLNNQYNYDEIIEKLKVVLIECLILYNNILPEKRYKDDYFNLYIESEISKMLKDLPGVYKRRKMDNEYSLKKIESGDKFNCEFYAKYPLFNHPIYNEQNTKGDCMYIFSKVFSILFGHRIEKKNTEDPNSPDYRHTISLKLFICKNGEVIGIR